MYIYVPLIHVDKHKIIPHFYNINLRFLFFLSSSFSSFLVLKSRMTKASFQTYCQTDIQTLVPPTPLGLARGVVTWGPDLTWHCCHRGCSIAPPELHVATGGAAKLCMSTWTLGKIPTSQHRRRPDQCRRFEYVMVLIHIVRN